MCSEGQSDQRLKGEGGDQGHHGDAPDHGGQEASASLDCIRVLSSETVAEVRTRSAGSRRRSSSKSRQAKRFGVWVLSKIFA